MQPSLFRSLTAICSVVCAICASNTFAYGEILDNDVNLVADAPATDAEAARFLTQATFGPTPAEITRLRSIGYRQWITQQLSMPATLQRPYVQALDAGIKSPGQSDRMEAWFHNAITAPDQLRQRMAWAMSQIMVASDQQSGLNQDPIALAEYYDILARDPFGYYDGNVYHAGNYYQLLYDVTRSPAMGRMLTYIRNQKSHGALSPDENYAREVMQLFSIGLVLRNPDFSRQLDASGNPIPTYASSMVQAYARVFTGWSYQSGFNSAPRGLGWKEADYLPMVCYEQYHEEGGEILLDHQFAAGGANSCEADLQAGLHAIANHQNIAPFISRQLIQRFVTSNPTPDYIQRVATVFCNSNGDLGQVISAILLDTQARTGTLPAQYSQPAQNYVFGKAREPLLKLTALWRYYNAAAQNGLYAFNNPQLSYGQRPLGASSVFNFYLPDYLPPGELGQPVTGVPQYGPEFQIINESSAIATANDLTARINAYVGNRHNSRSIVTINLSNLIPLAGNAQNLVTQLNHDLLYGSMSAPMNHTLVALLAQLPGDTTPTARVLAVLQVLLVSPEFAIQK